MGWRSYCLEIKSQDAYERLTGLDWVPSIDAGYVAEKDITPVGQSEDFFSGSEVAIPKGALFVVLPIDSGDLRMRAVFVDCMFRMNPNTHFGSIRSPISVQSDHLFRFYPITFSLFPKSLFGFP